MEKNTQLPVEVEKKLKEQFSYHTYSSGQRIDIRNFVVGMHAAYATNLHQVEQENAELRRQNDKMKQQAEGWRPLLEEVLKNDATFGKLPIKLIDKITKFLYGE